MDGIAAGGGGGSGGIGGIPTPLVANDGGAFIADPGNGGRFGGFGSCCCCCSDLLCAASIRSALDPCLSGAAPTGRPTVSENSPAVSFLNAY